MVKMLNTTHHGRPMTFNHLKEFMRSTAKNCPDGHVLWFLSVKTSQGNTARFPNNNTISFFDTLP